MTTKKAPNPTDRHVGQRVRMRRIMIGMSQERLAQHLDLTFQQVQKYEKGTNRIGASRLQQIATALQAPIAFFFENAPAGQAQPGEAIPPAPTYINEFLASSDGLALTKAFMEIRNPAMRRQIVGLVEQIAVQP